MKKSGLLNQPLSSVVAGLGHKDTLVIADAGLPIPPAATRIDLAVSLGVPALLDVVKAILTEMAVEQIILAAEIRDASPDMHRAILELLPDTPVEYVSHEEFKARCAAARGIARSGEFTPYANVLLVAGVTF